MVSIRTALRSAACGSLVLAGLASAAHAQSVLVLTGNGTSWVADALTEAGFNVVEGTLDPGQISSALATYPDIVEVWIWNDGSFGNTGSPADPLRDFDANDLADLAIFQASHPHFVMDDLAWRNEVFDANARAFSKNEANWLFSAGGGIVLGCDDETGDAIVQHVNQVATYFGFEPFRGAYATDPALQTFAGTLLQGPEFVDAAALFTTGSNCDVPHGAQPNGTLLRTVLFAPQTYVMPGYGSPELSSDSFLGANFVDVLHMVTTTIPSGDSQDFATFCFADAVGTPCPCGNDDPHGGCANSTGLGGRLFGYGSSSASADDLSFTAEQLPPNVFGILFAGTAPIEFPFGDGVRCAGGQIRRFGLQNTGPGGTLSVANIASYAGYVAGDRRFFQVWHRDAGGPCGHTTNVTNAIAVDFTP